MTVNVSEVLYETTIRAARPLVRAAGPLHPKLRRGLAGRSGVLDRLERWAADGRDRSRPLVWFHAPSVGEALMASAIMSELRERRPEVQLAFTHFSPSAEWIAERVGGDVHDYLPWDVRSDVNRALDALRPTVVAFVRTEIWPVLTREAEARGIRTALVNAVLGPRSGRLRPAGRWMLGPGYARLDAVGAVSEKDAGRFPELGVRPDRVRATGDARFDQVWRRVVDMSEDRPGRRLARWLGDAQRLTIVAGSTWPPDESLLVPAFTRLQERVDGRLIVAPHEPEEEAINRLERRLDEAGLRHARLGAMEVGTAAPEVVIIDRVGVLADLYAAADIAYVGGGFHDAGVHSVVEPGALEVPVVYGPRSGGAREARELADVGGGFIVEGPESLAQRLLLLADEPGTRRRAGTAALAYVRSRLDGAGRNAVLLENLLAASFVEAGD